MLGARRRSLDCERPSRLRADAQRPGRALAPGERKINLTTHLNDIANEIKWRDLHRVVLVGHSYGGLVITGVAEQVGDRIASIVDLDAFIPADGQPTATFTEKLRVTGAYQRVPRKIYVCATNGPLLDNAAALRSDAGWSVYDVEFGHDVEIDAPQRLAEILEASI